MSIVTLCTLRRRRVGSFCITKDTTGQSCSYSYQSNYVPRQRSTSMCERSCDWGASTSLAHARNRWFHCSLSRYGRSWGAV